MVGFSCRYAFQHFETDMDVIQQHTQLFNHGGTNHVYVCREGVAANGNSASGCHRQSDVAGVSLLPCYSLPLLTGRFSKGVSHTIMFAKASNEFLNIVRQQSTGLRLEDDIVAVGASPTPEHTFLFPDDFSWRHVTSLRGPLGRSISRNRDTFTSFGTTKKRLFQHPRLFTTAKGCLGTLCKGCHGTEHGA
jgi:hypothetical protein